MKIEQRIIESAAERIVGAARESGRTIEQAAEAWRAEADANGGGAETYVVLSPDETGRYSVDPTAPAVIARARELAKHYGWPELS